MWLNAVCIFKHFNCGLSESVALCATENCVHDVMQASQDSQKKQVISCSAFDIQDVFQTFKCTFGVLVKLGTYVSCVSSQQEFTFHDLYFKTHLRRAKSIRPPVSSFSCTTRWPCDSSSSSLSQKKAVIHHQWLLLAWKMLDQIKYSAWLEFKPTKSSWDQFDACNISDVCN